MCHRALTLSHTSFYTKSWDVHTLEYPRVCSHTREVEFDSQHAPSNATSGRQIVGLDRSLDRLESTPTSALDVWLIPLIHTPPQARLVGGRKT